MKSRIESVKAANLASLPFDFVPDDDERQAKTMSKTKWYLYLVRCADDTIYTGISIDVQARVDKHNLGKGAKYTSTRLPVSLIYSECHPDQSSAMKRELQVKSWDRKRKHNLARKDIADSAR